MPDQLGIPILIALAVVALFMLIVMMTYGWLWLQALTSGAPVGMPHLIGMALRRTPARLLVTSYIAARKAGLGVTLMDLEALHLAGGHVSSVVHAMAAAKHANIALDFKLACAIDLTGRDVVGVVAGIVNPKVLPCRDPFTKGDVVQARSSDGQRLKLKADLTVRTCLERVVGGGDEAATAELAGKRLIAIVAKRTAAEALADPAALGAELVAQDKESGSALEILSAEVVVREG